MRRAAAALASFAVLLPAAIAEAHDGRTHAPAKKGTVAKDRVATASGRTVVSHPDPKAKLPTKGKRRIRARASAAQLPPTWCGGQRTTDDTLNEVGATSLAKVKVVYAYPTDVGNRFTSFANLIQAYAGATATRVTTGSGNRRTVRFDLGTSCGPTQLDIQTVALPGTRASYYSGGQPALSLLHTPILSAAGMKLGQTSTTKPRTVLAYLDGMRATTSSYVAGEAYRYSSSAATGGPHDGGGLIAAVYGRQGTPPTSTTVEPTELGTWVHELLHAFGAVQDDAPHTSGGGHCTDEYDVMCYADGTGRALTYTCARGTGLEQEVLDCGGDDYFNPQPAAGSYLATHWNTYRSAFLGTCDELQALCGVPTEAPAPAPTPTEPPPTTTTPPPTTTTPPPANVAPVGKVVRTSTGTALKVNSTQSFSAAGSSDSDGSIVKYEWDVDGDGFDDGTGVTKTYIPRYAGSHRVRVRVTDNGGLRATAGLTFSVTA